MTPDPIEVHEDADPPFPFTAYVQGQPLTHKGHIRRFRTREGAEEAARREATT